MSNLVNKATTPAPPSTPQIDADVAALDAAFKGVGTKNDQLIQVMCTKSKDYIQQLRAVYNHGHTVDLLSKIQLETSGAFQRLFEAMLLTEPELRAHYIHRAVKGLGTDEMMLIDCILTASHKQIEETKAAYKKHFTIPMQLRVDLDTSGKLQKILDAVLNNTRPASGVDQGKVAEDLETLFKATEGRLGTNEQAIINIIATRSRDHLHHLNQAYKERSPNKRTFVETIKIETMSWTEKALVANFLGPAAWHAWRLHCEMRGLGTDEEGLLRSILLPTQSELRAAARILQTVYKEDLTARVKSELWGNMKNALSTYVAFVTANVADPGDAPDAGPQAPTDPAQQVAVAQSQQKSGGLPTGAKVGIGLGLGAVGILGVAGTVAAVKHHQDSKKQEAEAAQLKAAAAQPPAPSAPSAAAVANVTADSSSSSSSQPSSKEDKKDKKKEDKEDKKEKKDKEKEEKKDKKDKKGSDSDDDKKKKKK